MAPPFNRPGYRIESEDAARNWVLELVADVESARRACDVQTYPNAMRKAWATWMVRQGSALGVLQALHRCGKVSDVAYNDLHERVMRTMAPTVASAGSQR